MTERDDHIQRPSGLWIPKQAKLIKDQRACHTQQDMKSMRSWIALGQTWRHDPEIDQARQQFLQQRLQTNTIYPFQDIPLTRADLEWLIYEQKLKDEKNEDDSRQGLILRGAIFHSVNFSLLPLERADFSGVKLNGAQFTGAELKRAIFIRARLERTHFQGANLRGADLRGARLTKANFIGANLEGANFQFAKLANASFERATIVTAQGVGLMVADVTEWDETTLPIREWSQVKLLGDEAEAKKRKDFEGYPKDAITHFEDYFAATRAYRQLSTALDGMGRKEEAEKFAYRGQVMQRKMLWWSIWQRPEKNFFPSPNPPLWQRVADARAWLFSWLLAVLSGYGYRFGRSFFWYVGVLFTFAWLYVCLSQGVPPHSNIPDHLSWLDALILSVSDMVGRGFFRQDLTLSDLYAGWSVLEGVIGVFMDVLLISTLTQRLFKK